MGLGRTQHCPRCGHTPWTDGPAQIQDRYLQPYFSRRIELSVEGSVVLCGLRVVIPERLLEELYEEHSGMFQMKALARSFLWCPGLDQQIERKVRSCSACTRVANTPPTAPLQTWTWPVKPWQRVHLDYALLPVGGCTLKMARSHSHEQHYHRQDHYHPQEFAEVTQLWLTGR